MQKWLSGRRRTIGNRVGVDSVSRVQIPSSAPIPQLSGGQLGNFCFVRFFSTSFNSYKKGFELLFCGAAATFRRGQIPSSAPIPQLSGGQLGNFCFVPFFSTSFNSYKKGFELLICGAAAPLHETDALQLPPETKLPREPIIHEGILYEPPSSGNTITSQR